MESSLILFHLINIVAYNFAYLRYFFIFFIHVTGFLRKIFDIAYNLLIINVKMLW